MNQKHVVLVGHDAAPSKAFELVKAELEKRGCGTAAYLGNGKSILVELSHTSAMLIGADSVIIGMSAPADNAFHEIAIAEHAARRGVSYSFYADTFGAWKRQWFQEYLPNAKHLFVLNEKEREEAQKAFPNVNVVAVGNHEWEAACFPKYSREEIRQKLGIVNDEVCIFVPGHKSVAISAFLLMGVVHALHQKGLSHLKWRVLFAPHPGDGVSPKSYAEPVLYSSPNVWVEIITREKTYLHSSTSSSEPMFGEKEVGYPSSDLLSAADLVVESASTFCQAAALMRIPIISFLSEVSMQRNISVFGQRDWEPVSQGVSLLVAGNTDFLAQGISSLVYTNPSHLLSTRLSHIRGIQEAFYPRLTEKGQFARKIVDTILPS